MQLPHPSAPPSSTPAGRLAALLTWPGAGPPVRRRATRWADGALIALALAAGLFVLGTPEADPDLWGHLRFGSDTLAAGGPAATDPYSYVSGRIPWINHEWLAEAVFAGAYRQAGPAGLILLLLGATLAIAVLLERAAARAGFTVPGRLLWMALVFAQIKPGLGTVRPHLFTYAAFGLLMAGLARAGRGARAPLWAFIPLMALWANLHGGFLAGAAMLVVWTGAVALEGRRRGAPAAWTVAIPAGLALLATLATPYGWRLWWFLRTALPARPEISEWQPLALLSARGLAFAALAAIGLWALAADRRHVRPVTWLLWALSALLPFAAVRHTPLFGLATGILVTPHLASAIRRHAPSARGASTPAPWVPAVLGSAALLLGALALRTWGCLAILDPYPAAAVRRLAASGVSGNLATTFEWGEYVIYHLGPAIKVSIDGRRETVYGEAAYRRSLAFIWGTGDWRALIRDEPTDLALVPAGGPADRRLAGDEAWATILRADDHALYARRDFVGFRALCDATAPSGPAGRCFPGP